MDRSQASSGRSDATSKSRTRSAPSASGADRGRSRGRGQAAPAARADAAGRETTLARRERAPPAASARRGDDRKLDGGRAESRVEPAVDPLSRARRTPCRPRRRVDPRAALSAASTVAGDASTPPPMSAISRAPSGWTNERDRAIDVARDRRDRRCREASSPDAGVAPRSIHERRRSRTSLAASAALRCSMATRSERRKNVAGDADRSLCNAKLVAQPLVDAQQPFGRRRRQRARTR